jgi:hypothetical protein
MLGYALIRPSQDCALRYGHRVHFNRVDTPTPTAYFEQPLGTIDRDAVGGLACHTFNRCGTLEWIDTLGRIPRVPAMGRRALTGWPAAAPLLQIGQGP